MMTITIILVGLLGPLGSFLIIYKSWLHYKYLKLNLQETPYFIDLFNIAKEYNIKLTAMSPFVIGPKGNESIALRSLRKKGNIITYLIYGYILIIVTGLLIYTN